MTEEKKVRNLAEMVHAYLEKTRRGPFEPAKIQLVVQMWEDWGIENDIATGHKILELLMPRIAMMLRESTHHGIESELRRLAKWSSLLSWDGSRPPEEQTDTKAAA